MSLARSVPTIASRAGVILGLAQLVDVARGPEVLIAPCLEAPGVVGGASRGTGGQRGALSAAGEAVDSGQERLLAVGLGGIADLGTGEEAL